LLAEGQSVTAAGTAVGYATPSSFVAAFRSELHAAPREFMLMRRTEGATPTGDSPSGVMPVA
jgi:AraC-like DNA-binding protein